jgi:hypothetical protein
MPNGRPRNRNTRHANRQRQIQQNQQVQAEAVESEPVVVEAVPLDDTTTQLQQRIAFLERELEVKNRAFKTQREKFKEKFEQVKEMKGYPLDCFFNTATMRIEEVKHIKKAENMLFTAESFVLKTICSKYFNVGGWGSIMMNQDKMEKIRSDWMMIERHVMYKMRDSEYDECIGAEMFHSGTFVEYVIDCLYGESSFIQSRGVILKMKKGKAYDADDECIGTLDLSDMDIEWDEPWDEIYEDFHPNYDESEGSCFMYKYNEQVESVDAGFNIYKDISSEELDIMIKKNIIEDLMNKASKEWTDEKKKAFMELVENTVDTSKLDELLEEVTPNAEFKVRAGSD